ncbi:hypothetical protein A2U01_0053560, partial [Trifolium medium]|nr:hypothetical protein [Trifolium medium]
QEILREYGSISGFEEGVVKARWKLVWFLPPAWGVTGAAQDAVVCVVWCLCSAGRATRSPLGARRERGI